MKKLVTLVVVFLSLIPANAKEEPGDKLVDWAYKNARTSLLLAVATFLPEDWERARAAAQTAAAWRMLDPEGHDTLTEADIKTMARYRKLHPEVGRLEGDDEK